MKSILQDLFWGKIDIMEALPYQPKNPVPGEDSFFKSLSPEQRQTHEEILDALAYRSTLDCQKCFVFGFKMAVQMIFESISADTEDKLN